MKTSTIVLLATAALLITPTLLSAIQATHSQQRAILGSSTLYITTGNAFLTGNAQLVTSPTLLFNPAQALSVSTNTVIEALAQAPDRPDQAVTPTHERTVDPGESVHIVNTIDNRAVTITITVDVTVGEGATVNVDRDVHSPQGQISLPVVTPGLN